MVGLVIVSHSRRLAEAAAALAQAAAAQELPIDFAGGAGDDRNEPGTDATDVMEAITRVSDGDGVLVLMDHGSAVVSARLAEQLLGSDVPGIRLCPAPLVEGAVAAAARIAARAPVDAVYEEAKNALAGKYQDMEEEAPAAAALREGTQGEIVPGNALTLRFRMEEPTGMHLRPAAKLVDSLADFPGVSARIRNYDAEGGFFNANSINQISLANIRPGDAVEIALWGEEAEEALGALRALVRDVYLSREFDPDASDTAVLSAVPDEPDESAPPPSPVLLAPGAAVGALYIHRQNRDPLPPLPVADAEYEVARFDAALTRVRASIGRHREEMAARSAGDAEIMTTQLLILDDPGLLGQVRFDIRTLGRDAASCYQARMRELAAGYGALKNPGLRERAADVTGVCDHVLDALSGKSEEDLESLPELILWTEEATPDLLARWAPGQLRGILTRAGSPTSHVAILARAMGIPAIAGYAPPREATTGLAVAMDAGAGEVVIDPDAGTRADFEKRRDAWIREAAEERAAGAGPAVTADGAAVAVLANIGDAESARTALAGGAEGVGLFRTESMFLDRARPPGELEQAESLRSVFSVFSGMPITVRTFDVGGDARFAGLAADGSFLGVRGVRVYRKIPDFFRTQVRAILRAGTGRDIAIMIPMIATEEEAAFCRGVLDGCHEELSAEGAAHAWPVRFGIMVETPAAALRAGALGKMVDFFSIGTNDLTQYVMCAERGLADVAELTDNRQPAVREAIRLVVEAAEAAGIPVAVCGEMAADPAAVPELLRMGIRCLSVSASSVGRVKRAVRAARVSS